MPTRTARRPLPSSGAANGSRPRPAGTDGGAGGLATAKRSTPMALLGVVAVVGGALLFLALYSNVEHRQAVLAVARPVAVGQVITAADLQVVRVSTSSGVTPVPASRASSVAGRTAAVTLVPGTLLASAQLGSSSDLRAGQAIVGVALKAGQAPAALRAGTRVEVIDSTKSTSGDPGRPVVLTDQAVVSSSARSESSSSATSLVSLTLPSGDAPAVASAAADGRVSLVVVAP